MVDRTKREIEALEARSCVVTGLEQKAHGARVAILQRETFVMESQLVALKNTLGKVTGYEGDLTRPGLYGVMAVFLHTNQLAVPLLWAWLLRNHMYQALGVSARGSTEAPLAAP